MIEFSIAELVLFVWAIIATGYALMYREKEHNQTVFVNALVSNKELRQDFFCKIDEHIEDTKHV